MGRYSSVGIAAGDGLDGPGIESQRGRDFPQPSIPALGPAQTPIQQVPGLFPGSEAGGRGVDHRPPFSAEVKGKVELYCYSPLGFDDLFQRELYVLLWSVIWSTAESESRVAQLLRQATGCRTDESWSHSWQGQENFLSILFTLTLC